MPICFELFDIRVLIIYTLFSEFDIRLQHNSSVAFFLTNTTAVSDFTISLWIGVENYRGKSNTPADLDFSLSLVDDNGYKVWSFENLIEVVSGNEYVTH